MGHIFIKPDYLAKGKLFFQHAILASYVPKEYRSNFANKTQANKTETKVSWLGLRTGTGICCKHGSVCVVPVNVYIVLAFIPNLYTTPKSELEYI